jgi:chromosome segregation ATPase
MLASLTAKVEELHNYQVGDLSTSLADLAPTLSDINTKLSDLQSELETVATNAVVIEEIATVKEAQAHEHKTTVSATERIQSTLASLEEYFKNHLDQINVVSPAHSIHLM